MTKDTRNQVSRAHEPDADTSVADVKYVIKQGDCVSSIAKRSGHFWKTLWNHPDNAALKRIRGTPNVLLPGDRLFVPPLREKRVDGGTQERHKFIRRGEPSALRLRILECGEPVADKDWVLEVDGRLFSGTTDIQGQLSVSIPGNAREGELRIGDHSFHLALGCIDPLSEVSGIQSRLANLRYDCGVTGRLDEQTIEALNRFRSSVGLMSSDRLDDETRAALERWHDDMQGRGGNDMDSDLADVEDEDANLQPASDESPEADLSPSDAEPNE